MAGIRSKCEIDHDRLSKLLRANVQQLDEQKHSGSDMDAITSNYVHFIIDVLQITRRLNPALLLKACQSTFNCTHGEARLFSLQMVAAIKHCKVKKLQSTSGKKLHPAVLEVVQVLKTFENDDENCNSSPATSLAPALKKSKFLFGERQRRALHRRLSEESEQAVPTASAGHADMMAQLYMSKPEVYKLYGLDVADFQKHDDFTPADAEESVREISSDEEQLPKPSSSSSSKGNVLEFFDSHLLTMVRQYEGRREEAIMEAGPGGFAIAVFADGIRKATECPNLVLETSQQAMKRPAACLKRPAACKRPAAETSKKPAVAEKLSEDEEREESEEVEDDPVVAVEVDGDADDTQEPTYHHSQLKITKATNAAYLCIGKKPCIVNCSKSQANNNGWDHWKVIERIHEQLIAKETFTKSFAVSLKRELFKTKPAGRR